MQRAVLGAGIAIGCLALCLTILVLLTPSKSFAADISTPAGCAAVGGRWDPGNANVPIPGCIVPTGPAGTTPAITATTACGQLLQAYQINTQLAGQDGNDGSARASHIAAANAAMAGYNSENCANGGPAAARNALQQRVQNNLNAANARLAAAQTQRQKLNTITNNLLSTDENALAYLANQDAEREDEREQAAAQADYDRAVRDAQAAQVQAQEEAADAKRRAALCNAFDGSCARQASSPDNPFAAQSGGGATRLAANDAPNPFNTPATTSNPFVSPGAGSQQLASADPPPEPPRPARKLGDPKQAEKLSEITTANCEAMIPHAEIIQLPQARGYCVVEVDKPELTHEWHYLADETKQPANPKFRLPKNPDAVSNGVRD